ncbi:MAG: 3-ketoacyl-ACP reductase [Lysobacterales bacterium]|jgi:NAD(P)-dependent dehydrogenase (short-subunit alcohol dehydrogenase family)
MSEPAVVLVTGASRGLGRGIAVELAKSGYSVAINYAGNAEAADEAARLCKAAASNPEQRFLPFRADISKADERAAMLDAVTAEFGQIDALVNNAGVAPKVREDIVEASEESFDRLVSINLKGPYFLTQAVVKRWLEGGESRLEDGFKIVFVTSISARTASPSRGDYCMTKAGLSMAAQLWANRLSADGIGVYELRPGIMRTDMTASVEAHYDQRIKDGLVPQRRWGTARDVGLAVAALVDGKFPYSTGTVIDIDGGFQMRTLK